MDLSTVLASGVVAGLVAGLVTLRTAERKIVIENITQQRRAWREKVRSKAIEVVQAFDKKETVKLRELYVGFQVILNPEDPNDNDILDSLWAMLSENASNHLVIEFSEKLSLLLKHDWERAKREAKPAIFRFGEPKRVAYSAFTRKRQEKQLTRP